MTPMLAVLAVIELSDVIFAVDSIPAIFGVTRETFIVFSAAALALIGCARCTSCWPGCAIASYTST